jgi:FkbM family methyltransferase
MMNTVALPRPVLWFQGVEFPHKLGICERLFGRTLIPRGICWVQTGAGIAWKLDLRNSNHRWVVYGKYEGSPFLDWARAHLPANGVVVDSGANIGMMLLYLAQWVPHGKVLAFEPGREQADWLQECLDEHDDLPVELIRAGLGSSHGMLYLQESTLSNDHGGSSQISDTQGEPVQITRLMDELAARSIDGVDLWKLDVEGYEIPALEGAEQLLLERRIKTLYVELSGENGPRVRDYLAEFGYQCHLFDQNGELHAAREIPWHTNGLFF